MLALSPNPSNDHCPGFIHAEYFINPLTILFGLTNPLTNKMTDDKNASAYTKRFLFNRYFHKCLPSKHFFQDTHFLCVTRSRLTFENKRTVGAMQRDEDTNRSDWCYRSWITPRKDTWQEQKAKHGEWKHWDERKSARGTTKEDGGKS